LRKMNFLGTETIMPLAFCLPCAADI